ncbi:MAG: SH3 domain-containing protein [Lachnospiraceae bacterium]|nr:SH3 domain-containing protein [Lachnospiraceae bacterium]
MKDRKRRVNGQIIRGEASQQLKTVLADYLLLFKEWVVDYGKIILPVLLLAFVVVTIWISLGARGKVQAAAVEANSAIEETKTDVQELTEAPFKEDAYPEVNELIQRYYRALEIADVEEISLIQSVLTNTERIRLRKMSDYIDRYENIKVYSKDGPYAKTYITYVYSDVFLKGREESFPGLMAFYICTGDAGELFITTGELLEQEAEYLKKVAAQSDVADLKNRVSVAYNNVMESNEDLRRYWAEVSVAIDTSVGEQLALEAKLQAQIEEEEKGDTETGGESGELSDQPSVPEVTRVRTTTYVNVRKSASASADRIGNVGAGTVLEVIEVMKNGWTKVKYGGGEGYISSEYLEEMENVDKYASNGTVTATATLNVREKPSTSANKIGVLAEGQTADLIEMVDDGWCKIKFDGRIGYVSGQYVK